jgi:hypothetical protein
MKCAEQRVAQEGSSPSGARMRSAVSKGGVNSLAGREGKVRRCLNGHESESRIQPRRTKPPLAGSGGQGVHREMASERHEEKNRAAIEGRATMNRSANGGERSSLLHSGEGVLIHPTFTKVCAGGTVRKNSA